MSIDPSLFLNTMVQLLAHSKGAVARPLLRYSVHDSSYYFSHMEERAISIEARGSSGIVLRLIHTLQLQYLMRPVTKSVPRAINCKCTIEGCLSYFAGLPAF